MAVSVALYLPFWVGLPTLQPVLFQTNRVVWSPGALLIALGANPTFARVLCATAWLGICVLVARRNSPVAERVWIIQLATLLLLTTAFFAHYLVPLVALAAIAGNPRLERLTLALSIGALAAYAVELLAPAFDVGWIGSSGYQALGSLITLGPAAFVLLASAGGWRVWPQARAFQPQT
jgi:hypothetical protein